MAKYIRDRRGEKDILDKRKSRCYDPAMLISAQRMTTLHLAGVLTALLLWVLSLAPPGMAEPPFPPAPLDVVIFDGNYPPFNIQEDKRSSGLGPDLLAAVFERMDQQFTLRSLPWNRAMRALREGQADAVLPLFQTPERERFLIYPEEPLFLESNSFFVLKDSEISYDEDLNAFRGHPISVVQDYSYGPDMNAASFLDLRPSMYDDQMVRMVLHGRYPIGIGNRYVVSFFAAKEGMLDAIRFLEPQVTTSPAYIAFSRKRGLGDLAQRFSRELKLFKKTKAHQELLALHGIY